MPTAAYLHSLSHGVKLYCNSTVARDCPLPVEPEHEATRPEHDCGQCVVTGHELSRQPSKYPYLILIQTIASLPANEGSPGVMHASPKSGSHFRYLVECGSCTVLARIRADLIVYFLLAFLPISSQLGFLDRGGASGLAVAAVAATAAAAVVAVTMSLTKAQQNAYKKMKEQKNKAPAGQTAEGKAKSKADAEAHVCQVG